MPFSLILWGENTINQQTILGPPTLQQPTKAPGPPPEPDVIFDFCNGHGSSKARHVTGLHEKRITVECASI